MSAGVDTYPRWKYYPARSPAPVWVSGVVGAFASLADEIDSRRNSGVQSDQVLAQLRSPLEAQGFMVETSKAKTDKILRPVLFGENGATRVAYEVDAFHPDHGVVIEIEAGRGAANDADYRDIIRASLMVDARYLVLAMMLLSADV